VTDCRDALDVLYEYLDNQLEDLRSKNIKQHLDLCRACFGVYEFERLLRERMRMKTQHLSPDHLKKRIQDIVQEY